MSRAPLPSIAGKPIGVIGYGLMGFTAWHNTPFEDAIIVMKTALENGANFWNAGTFYGPPERNSLHLLRHYFTRYPEDAPKIFLSLKGAYNAATHTADCTPSGIRASVNEALRVLEGCKSIDLFECARVDPSVPVETSVQTLAELITEGKIGSYGLSEVGAATVRKAHAIHPVAAVEIELSMFSRHVLGKEGVAQTCRELGIPLIAYSPLDRGWLTGELKQYGDLHEDDYRRHMPRFQPGAFEHNVKLAEKVEAMAVRKGLTAPQVAIAWVRRQGAIPIPGATKSWRVIENCADVCLSDDEMAELQGCLDDTTVIGGRYPAALQPLLNL